MLSENRRDIKLALFETIEHEELIEKEVLMKSFLNFKCERDKMAFKLLYYMLLRLTNNVVKLCLLKSHMHVRV